MKAAHVPDPLRRGLLAGGLAALLGPHAAAAPAPSWTSATPASQGMAVDALEAALVDGAALPALRGLLVARNGVLVAERYYGGASVEQPRRINSATKSVVSLLVGQSLAQGRLASLSQTVGELLPAAVGAPAAAITLRQILTGTSGLAYDSTRDMRALIGAPDPLQHVLALPRSEGTASWSYNDAAISLLTPVLERAWGAKLPDIARQALFAPLGIDTFRWAADRSGQAQAYMGLELLPRDFLLLASMVADGGRGIVPGAWLAESQQPHAGGAWTLPQVTGGHYGYLWFNGTLHGRPVAWAWGYGGQLAVVVPSQRLAVVTLAIEPPPQALQAQNAAIGGLVARAVGAAA